MPVINPEIDQLILYYLKIIIFDILIFFQPTHFCCDLLGMRMGNGIRLNLNVHINLLHHSYILILQY